MDTTNMLRQGTLLRNGTYRVEAPLSSGGFGNTYLVINQAFNERYAMKEFFMRGVNMRGSKQEVTVSVPDNHSSFEGQLQKFQKEAQRLRRLHNDHIVRVHDLFPENGSYYYVMDYIDGDSLSTIMKRQNRPMTEDEVMLLLPQMLDALEVVHGQEPPLLHLDIKPGNIMLDKDKCLYLIDFGASKQLHDTGVGMQATASALAYTPGYAPMEQVEQAMDKFGPWTDFYALGATLYYLLTNEQPPSFTSLSESDAFRFPAGTSERTQQLIKWLMMPHRNDRPKSVAEIDRWLQQSASANDGGEATQLSGGTPVGSDGEETQMAGGAAAAAEGTSEATQLSAHAAKPVTHDDPVPPVTVDNGEKKKKSKSGLIWLLVLLLVAGLGVGAYFLFFNESKEMKEAKAALDRYEELVERAEELIEESDADDYAGLTEADPIVDRIISMDEKHGEVLPEEYCRGEELQEQLNDKKTSVAEELVEKGNDADDWRSTFKFYEDSYKLVEKDDTKEKMDRAAFMINYMYITDVKFGNCDYNLNMIDEPGATLYAGRVKYLRPYVYYRGLKEGETANLKLKYIRPNGTLMTGSSSPEGYSTKYTADVENFNYDEDQIAESPLKLLGWGNDNYESYQTAGEYTFEIWCDGIFLYRTTVELH